MVQDVREALAPRAGNGGMHVPSQAEEYMHGGMHVLSSYFCVLG